MNYLEYNREERDICAHLFRLLLDDQKNWGPLKEFIGTRQVSKPRIYCEVALIRDAYRERKQQPDDIHQFMNNLCDLIARQNKVKSYTLFMNLPGNIKNPQKTHPRQIRSKLIGMGLLKSEGDQVVYGNLQAMFNAKPDLVVCNGPDLVVYEAKYKSGFGNEQMERTKKIGCVWKKLLYRDLGFATEPSLSVRKLGMASQQPDIAWEKVYDIAVNHWGENDFSVAVLSKVLSAID